MFLNQLPDISDYSPAEPQLVGNRVIYAHTHQKYFYPGHKTPFLFVTNFLRKGSYLLNNKPIEVTEKQFYLLNKNDELEINFPDKLPLQTLMILFEESFLQECFAFDNTMVEEALEMEANRRFEPVSLPNVPFASTQSLQQKIGKILQQPLSQASLDEQLFALLQECKQQYRVTSQNLNRIKAVKQSTREELYRRLFLAREIMMSHLEDALSLDQLASAVCLNKYHLLYHFKNHYQSTPNRYFMDLKFGEAYRLLSQGRLSVTEVCHRLGFESVPSFSNSFKKRYSKSPSELLLRN